MTGESFGDKEGDFFLNDENEIVKKLGCAFQNQGHVFMFDDIFSKTHFEYCDIVEIF